MTFQKKFLLRAPAAAKTDGGESGGGEAPLLDDKGAFSGDDGAGKKAKPAAKVETPVEKVKVRVGNDEIETDAASAAAINALMQSNSQLYGYLQQMQGTQKPKAEEKKAGYDYATGLFTEPEVALQKLRDEIKAEVKGEITTAYTAAETQKGFWNSFYKDNKDLEDEKMLVNAVMARDWNSLKDMSPEAAAKKIAENTKKEIMRLNGGKSPSDPDAREVEGGGANKKAAPNGGNSDDNKVLSLSEIIKKRQEARRKAQFSKE